MSEMVDTETLTTTFAPLDQLPYEGGTKDDMGKLPMHLLPPEFLTGTAAVLDFGAKKYAPRNWERGLDYSRVFSALQRHMWAWWSGEGADSETGMSHLWHASCCLAFLVAYEARGTGHDDRPAALSEVEG